MKGEEESRPAAEGRNNTTGKTDGRRRARAGKTDGQHPQTPQALLITPPVDTTFLVFGMRKGKKKKAAAVVIEEEEEVVEKPKKKKAKTTTKKKAATKKPKAVGTRRSSRLRK